MGAEKIDRIDDVVRWIKARIPAIEEDLKRLHEAVERLSIKPEEPTSRLGKVMKWAGLR